MPQCAHCQATILVVWLSSESALSIPTPCPTTFSIFATVYEKGFDDGLIALSANTPWKSLISAREEDMVFSIYHYSH